MWHSRPPRDPPPFMANAILNFHFDFLNPSLRAATCCQRLQNSKLPPREDPALELVIELGIASAEGGNILKHQNYSDCHHHDLKVAQTH